MKKTTMCDNLKCTKTTIFQQQMRTVHCSKCNSGNYCCQACLKEDEDHYCVQNGNLNLDSTMQVDSSVNETLLLIQQQKRTLKDYEFIQGNKGILGNGAFGEVRLAIDIELEQEMAIKILNKKKMLRNCNIKQLEKEIKLQRKLNHPNIIQFYHAFEDNDNIYLILEYAPCGSLYSYIKKKVKLPENEAFVYFFQSCLAIDYLHKKGVVHRDLKPENILLDSQGNVKVCDFGWSAETVDARNTFCGTYDYMAPEMLHNNPHDYRVDIWALGILLYELLHGKAPFTRQHFQKENIQKLKINFSNFISLEAQDLISNILKPDVNQRLSLQKIFQHSWMIKYAEEFGQDIQDYIYVPSQTKQLQQESLNNSKIQNETIKNSKLYNDIIKEESNDDSREESMVKSIKRPDFLNESTQRQIQKKSSNVSFQQKSEISSKQKKQNESRDSSLSSESENSQIMSRSFQKQHLISNERLGSYEINNQSQCKQQQNSQHKFISQDLQLSLNSFSNNNKTDQKNNTIVMEDKNIPSFQFYGNSRVEEKIQQLSPKVSITSQNNNKLDNFESSPYFSKQRETNIKDQLLDNDDDDEQKEKFSFGSQKNSYKKENSFEFTPKEEEQTNLKKMHVQSKETRLSKLSVIQSEESEIKSDREDYHQNQYEIKQRSSSANTNQQQLKQQISQIKQSQDLYLVTSNQIPQSNFQNEQKIKNKQNVTQTLKNDQINNKGLKQKGNVTTPKAAHPKKFYADYRNYNLKDIDKEDRNRFQDYKDSTKQLEIRSRELQAIIYSQDDKFSQRKSVKKTQSNQNLSFLEKVQLAFGCLGNR